MYGLKELRGPETEGREERKGTKGMGALRD